ncbi:Uncharacterised protein [Acinetobacter baumannii]|nr:hypothetical protein CPT_Minot_233 [Acinetobacter phage Minot]QQO96676.1 hypothetical protein CPT_Mokit_234 [Acinetobacter phage Mokit]QQO96931.1 hypothetical protein CPT_Melin_239 [Acinetobacter phage Melin]SSU39500.1 Uncharacterised protein [Acinetobacter baumannii]
MIEVGNVYEITQEWLDEPFNAKISLRMPEFKLGAKFKVIETESILSSAPDAISILNMDTNEYHEIEDCPIADLVWSFFSAAEERKGFIKLVN